MKLSILKEYPQLSTIKGKGKGNVHPRKGQEGPEGE
jgi:hypothetical protein